jgi:hypothetical protein
MGCAEGSVTSMRRITIALASFILSVASSPLGASDRHVAASPIKQAAEFLTADRASFVGGAVVLNKNASFCAPRPLGGARQRVVDIALGEWARFGHQSVDVSKQKVRLIPEFSAPLAPTPLNEPKLLARIGGFWAVEDTGSTHIHDQNKRWKWHPEQEWQDHWSAAFTSWVMCEAGLGTTQFARNVRHASYVEHALTDRGSAFKPIPPGGLPQPGDLLCAAVEDPVPGKSGFDPTAPNPDYRLIGHCYVVVASDKTATYIVGGNVVDWSKAPRAKFGSVGLLIVDNGSIAAMGPSTPCKDDRPCWLLGLGLKSREKATYKKSPLSAAARAMFDATNTKE